MNQCFNGQNQWDRVKGGIFSQTPINAGFYKNFGSFFGNSYGRNKGGLFILAINGNDA